MNSFVIGEVAELVYSRFGNEGTECTVTGHLEHRFNRITRVMELSYAIDVAGTPYLALPDQLRKKRPPQDWISLCHLDVVSPERELENA